MSQITEDYVSFETAKLLKEKGFDEKCFALYDPNGILIQSGIRLTNTQVERVEGSYSACTLQMAMKWLNESHNLYIFARPYVNEDGVSYLYEIKRLHKHKLMIEPVATETCFEKSEQACEAAIKYCLENLI